MPRNEQKAPFDSPATQAIVDEADRFVLGQINAMRSADEFLAAHSLTEVTDSIDGPTFDEYLSMFEELSDNEVAAIVEFCSELS